MSLISFFLFSELDVYKKLIPPSALPYLKEQLDWDNNGVDCDLCEIADQLVNWEVHFAIPFRLTQIEIEDLKVEQNNPVLLR